MSEWAVIFLGFNRGTFKPQWQPDGWQKLMGLVFCHLPGKLMQQDACEGALGTRQIAVDWNTHYSPDSVVPYQRKSLGLICIYVDHCNHDFVMMDL